jgi:hypothetical protein
MAGSAVSNRRNGHTSTTADNDDDADADDADEDNDDDDDDDDDDNDGNDDKDEGATPLTRAPASAAQRWYSRAAGRSDAAPPSPRARCCKCVITLFKSLSLAPPYR